MLLRSMKSCTGTGLSLYLVRERLRFIMCALSRLALLLVCTGYVSSSDTAGKGAVVAPPPNR